jgi:hypothetical protein
VLTLCSQPSHNPKGSTMPDSQIKYDIQRTEPEDFEAFEPFEDLVTVRDEHGNIIAVTDQYGDGQFVFSAISPEQVREITQAVSEKFEAETAASRAAKAAQG